MAHPFSLRLFVHVFKVQPRLIFSVALFALVYVALPQLWALNRPTRWLVAWNVAVLLYLTLVCIMCVRSTAQTARAHARMQSESRFVLMLLVVLATVAALVAIVAELATVKDLHGAVRNGHLGLTALTVVSAWFFIHTMFGLHYAHDYFDALAHQRLPGLDFPGHEELDYSDFMYCAYIIGTSGQTADVAFSGRTMRHVGMIHCVLAYAFNTVVLAMTINIAAGLF